MTGYFFQKWNRRAASQKTKALKAYKSYMAKKGASAKFAVAYLDKDSVPELIYYVPSRPLYKVFTWKSGKGYFAYSGGKYKCVLNRNNSFGTITYYKVSGTKSLTYTKLSASQFNTSLKKLVGNTKATKLTYYKNTSANRTKRLK